MEHLQDTATEWSSTTADGVRVACTCVGDATREQRTRRRIVARRPPVPCSLTGRATRPYRRPTRSDADGPVGAGVDDTRPR